MKIMLLLLAAGIAMAQITEVMYNPSGDDNNLEYIEVCGYRLEGWVVADSASNDTLVALPGGNSECALIVEEGYNCTGTCYSAGATIGNNLGNTADCIYLYDTGLALVDSLCYDGSLANGNGMALELVDGAWVEGYSPGLAYFLPEDIVLPEENNTENINISVPVNCTCNQDTIPPKAEENITAEIPVNNTEANYSSAPENISISTIDNSTVVTNTSLNGTTQANISVAPGNLADNASNQTEPTNPACTNISIEAGRDVLAEGEKLQYTIVLDSVLEDFAITYWAEDLNGNIVKSPYTSTNANQRSWTPSCSKGDAFLLRAVLEGCDSTAEGLVAVSCPEAEDDSCTVDEPAMDESVKIVQVSPDDFFLKPMVSPPISDEHLTLEEMEKLHIAKVLYKTNYNKNLSCKILNLPRTTLWRKMKKYGLLNKN